MDILLEVLKWIMIVLVAGFIGQFGKSISLHIIDYFKKRKAARATSVSDLAKERPPASIETKEVTVKQEVNAPPTKEEKDKEQAKAEKKALKAQLKARKKEEKAK